MTTATTFRALMLHQTPEKTTQARLEDVPYSDLPEGDVQVRVRYSSLNYKDGLAVTGLGKVVRRFPMVGGIDFVGEVTHSSHADYHVGQTVVLTGWGVGEQHWGGFAQVARVSGDWLVPLPADMSPQQAMSFGTAGFTAMMAIMALEAHGVHPQRGDVLVTGAGGGVGSLAVMCLAALGYRVVASSGREALYDTLMQLGAAEVIGRLSAPERPMSTPRWAGVVDAVGGDTLANALSATQYGGSVAAFGLTGGSTLNTTVFPFILRGVNLLGIDSVMCPATQRAQVWARLAALLPNLALERVVHTARLSDVPALAEQITRAEIFGRVVIDVDA